MHREPTHASNSRHEAAVSSNRDVLDVTASGEALSGDRRKASVSQVPAPLRFLGGNLGSTRGLDGLVGDAVGRAPVPVPDGAQFEERNYANEAGSRAYKLYVPSGYNARALPLVVMLHGCTQSPDDFAAGTRMNELAEELTFLVAYPAQDSQPMSPSAGTGSTRATSSAIRASPR